MAGDQRRRELAADRAAGLVMQVLVLVVQNDVQPSEIGVATSTATFSRSVGGSFGVAIFGAIFAGSLSGELAKFPRAVTSRLGSGIHLNPEQAKHLPPAVHADFLQAFAHSLNGVFLFGMARSWAFALSWFLKGGAAADDTRPERPARS